MAARLIVNADDFGMTRGVNRAVAELYRAGALSSASLMAKGGEFDDAVKVAKENPGLGVGCHLVFVDGVPVSSPREIGSLMAKSGDGFRASLPEFVGALLRGAIRREELEIEAVAQIRRLQEAGIAVTHVDTHKHLHCFPVVLEAVMGAMQRTGVTRLRMPFEPEWSRALARASLTRRVQMAAIGRQEQGFRRATLGLRVRGWMPEGTMGIAATGSLDERTLRDMLQRVAVEPGDKIYELCCHPGYVDDALLAAKTRLKASREVECEAMLAVVPDFSREIHAEGAVRLIHYGDLNGVDEGVYDGE